MQGHDHSEEERLSPLERQQRVRRAALLRPMSLLMLAIGAFAFALSLSWWIPPLTLATYAALVFLAVRDPHFQRRVLADSQGTSPVTTRDQDASPKRRARRLPRGETRRDVEKALEIHRRTMFAIEESDEVARATLDNAIPKLHGLIDRVVDIALVRERVAGAIQEIETGESEEDQTETLGELRNHLRAVDMEIPDTLAKLSSLRSRVVRLSLESGDAAHEAATRLSTDLDELNHRLEALRATLSHLGPPDS